MLQILWFKRDLRLVDHAALTAAALRGPVLPLYVVEPAYWQQDDASSRQWSFLRDCVADLARHIAARGGQLCIQQGDMLAILEGLKVQHGRFILWAHEETGNWWTFERDKAVRAWCKANGCGFEERRQFGVFRGRAVNRDRWSTAWDKQMTTPTLAVPTPLFWERGETIALPSASDLGLAEDGLLIQPEAGRDAALACLNAFLHTRGEHYSREMSSPISAEHACSRLSWHISYGTLSIREVAQAAWSRYRAFSAADKAWRQSLRSFIARLHWHCHFIQKLESEPEAEWRPFAQIYQGLRPRPADERKLAAWSDGRTGYPFVDAAMRYLNAKGWINFRMRAMLMSFASYDLWLPWQESGLKLAQKFIDYEPGIHWPQCQMQSGETGINTIRIYSPVKQGYDQDPKGRFIRQWVKELARVPDAFLHEPWKMPEEDFLKCAPDYPARIVDHVVASKEAREKIYARRRMPEARVEARAVVVKHGSRKHSGRRKWKVSDPAAQLDMDF